MLKKLFLILGLALVAGEACAETLATVDGVPVTAELVQQELKSNPELAKQPNADKAILEKLIAGELLLHEAQSLKLDQDKAVKIEIQSLTRRALVNAAVNRYLEEHPVSDEEIKARYEELIKPYATEYHTRHILVKTEEEAKAIRAKIKTSDEFAEQAKLMSTDDESAKKGGDLGWYNLPQLMKPLSEIMAKLKKGEISQPVKTEFGWHILELLDTRSAKQPSLEETREGIAKQLANERIEQYIGQLRAKAKITRP